MSFEFLGLHVASDARPSASPMSGERPHAVAKLPPNRRMLGIDRAFVGGSRTMVAMPAPRQPSRKAPRGGGSSASQRRKTKKRDREVLDTAARVFYERGYSDASVQDVADELGILKGSLYHYIKTK